MNVADFVAKWAPTAGSERSNAAPFLVELCDVLGVERPVGVTGDAEHDVFVLEHRADVPDEDGPRRGRIDLYKKGCFVLEAKQGSHADGPATQTAPRRGSYRWTQLMRDARGQAEAYARGLEDPPPFLIVVDVGYAFDLYACFDGTFRYRPFPDPPRSRIFLKDLAYHLDLLRTIFTEPMTLDPAKRQALVTKDIAAKLAELAKTLEEEGHAPALVARFLMRCIFTMFAEDVGLLPERIFTRAIEEYWIKDPSIFASGVESLWHAMNEGGNYVAGKLLRFNGGLFRDQNAIPLNEKQLQLLLDAAKRDWSDVEPAIFGTLLERALDKKERHQLGAHFTPRAYVERLVRPTIEEPLRDEWGVVQVAVRHHIEAGNEKAAKKALHDFHKKLCSIRVLDPACGSGNFLYVALDLLKQLEAEVLSFLRELGESQELLDLQHVTVTPEQFLGIEAKGWAKEIAELVLWIGYLRWHFKARGEGKPPPEPVLQDHKNIECRDAILAWDGEPQPVHDDAGAVVTAWDGETMVTHPVSGELVPDESAQRPLLAYPNARRAAWPAADFIIGNPPFIGNKRMRQLLGDGYVESLRSAYPELPETIDYVMYWWHRAAQLVAAGHTRRFGLIATNSLSQTFNRKVVADHLGDEANLRIAFAIPDHPWVDTDSAAAVRIAMTVVGRIDAAGLLAQVVPSEDSAEVRLSYRRGKIHPDLTVGVDVRGGTTPLQANADICLQGCKLVGAGFLLDREERDRLAAARPEAVRFMPRYVTGREITKRPLDRYVIDFYGLSEEDAKRAFPEGYQILLTRVKPERDHNKRRTRREKWWLFGENAPKLRRACAGLRRFIATSEVARHRVFVFLDLPGTLADGTLAAVALDDAYFLGVLSSRLHVVWSLAAGGRMGVGNDPRYQNGPCFLPFPFPTPSEAQKAAIRDVAERLDEHRRERLAQHERLTITTMYNVLEKLREGAALSSTEQAIYERGLIAILHQLHEQLDEAVFAAYGWPTALDDEELLQRLVALNAARAADEAAGGVAWLRPEVQRPAGSAAVAEQVSMAAAQRIAERVTGQRVPKWPKALEERIAAVHHVLTADPVGRSWSVEEVAAGFKRARRADVKAILDSLRALGYLVESSGRYRLLQRNAA